MKKRKRATQFSKSDMVRIKALARRHKVDMHVAARMYVRAGI